MDTYTLSLFSGTEMLSQGQYIDPNNYADPLELLKSFASEIERNSVTVEKIVGGGKQWVRKKERKNE